MEEEGLISRSILTKFEYETYMRINSFNLQLEFSSVGYFKMRLYRDRKGNARAWQCKSFENWEQNY